MSTLRVGVIGCGVIAPTHVESYQKLDGVKVTWACDLVADKAQKLAAKYGIEKTTTDYREMLADPDLDAVSICTDHASHAPIATAALRRGKHVLCEKALAANRKGLDRMLAEHRKHRNLVFEGVFQHRFDAVPLYVKGLVDGGLFGKILTAGVQVRCLRTKAYYESDAWRGTWAKEGGAILINQAIHYIDVLVWTMGGVESLCGIYDNLTHQGVMQTEDTAAAAVRFRCGAVGTIEATCSSHLGWECNVSIHGDAGSLELRNDQPLKVAFADAARQAEVQKGLEAALKAPGALLGKSYYGSGHPAQLADFVEAIREKRKPFIPAVSARHTVDVVLGIYESYRKRRWVKLPKFG